MKVWVAVLFFVALASSQEYVQAAEELPLAEPCNPQNCQLPDCRCSSTDIPGGLQPRDTPQFVLVTFDDGVNVQNIETYRKVLYNRRNHNGCIAESTFFVQHEYTNYEMVNELYNQGFEIALHSISHQTPQSYWQEASYEDMMREFGDQKIQMAHFANIPYEDIKGVRIPYLQMTGNASFQVMADRDLLYDSSWSTYSSLNPGMWPYTLHYASTQECPVPPCPTASIPGPWVKPMISWIDNSGFPCAMVDACINVPELTDADAWFHFIVRNFERHYKGNRAPFGFYAHEWLLSTNPAVEEAVIRFLDMINRMEDVFMVRAHKVIDWTRNPVPLSEYSSSAVGRCTNPTFRTCAATNCGPLHSTHNGIDYWMGVCTPCPNTYPWLGNPLGQ